MNLPNRNTPVVVVHTDPGGFEQMTHERRLDEAPDRIDALEAQLAELRARIDALESAK